MKCKFCGAEVKLGERCQYCGSVAEAFYYKPEEPPEVVGRNTLKKQREKARFLHMIFTIMQQEAETRCMAGK